MAAINPFMMDEPPVSGGGVINPFASVSTSTTASTGVVNPFLDMSAMAPSGGGGGGSSFNPFLMDAGEESTVGSTYNPFAPADLTSRDGGGTGGGSSGGGLRRGWGEAARGRPRARQWRRGCCVRVRRGKERAWVSGGVMQCGRGWGRSEEGGREGVGKWGGNAMW